MLRRGMQLVLRRGGRPLLRLEVWLGMWLRVSRYLWFQWWEVLGWVLAMATSPTRTARPAVGGHVAYPRFTSSCIRCWWQTLII